MLASRKKRHTGANRTNKISMNQNQNITSNKNLQAIAVKLLVCLMVYIMPCMVVAQDPHYSQFYASPMLLNPANTGLFSGTARLSTTYRNQWRTISTPFTTASVACDFQILNNTIPKKDVFGLGFIGTMDQSNNQGLKSNYGTISLAYNKGLDQEGYHKLGLGFQATLVSKRVDYSRFVFSRQFTPNGFDMSLSTGEPINGFNLNYADLATGILYSGMNSNEHQWYAGASYYHITRPNESITSAENRLQSRVSLHGGYNLPVHEYARLYFSSLYMQSALASEIMVGAVLESNIQVNAFETTLFTGLYLRNKDAVIPYLGINNGNLQVGLSYDINLSSLATATQSRGGFELSLVMNLSKDPETNKVPKCFNRF
jgi:type IX secretion system PorP/SprF family membrane protein